MPVFRLAMVLKPPRKAKEEPRKAGTLNLVHTWKNRVPMPAKNRVVWMSRGRPYCWTRMGTRMVAPNMANMCWRPSTSILGVPSFRASRMGSFGFMDKTPFSLSLTHKKRQSHR